MWTEKPHVVLLQTLRKHLSRAACGVLKDQRVRAALWDLKAKAARKARKALLDLLVP